jgi:hypothetical protein
MDKQVSLVAIRPESVDVDGQSADKYTVTTGEKRTLFFVFKSDDIAESAFGKLSAQIHATLAPEEGTKAVIVVMSPQDSFEIHEMETK